MIARLRSLDLVGPLLAVAAVGIFLLRGFDASLNRDLALYTYSAQQFAEGLPPYVAVLNRAGPLAHLVPGLAVVAGRTTGVDDILAARIALMVLSVVCVWLLYLLTRDLFRSRVAGVAAVVTLLNLVGFVTYATGGPREKTTMVLFLIAALWAMTRRRWVLAGAATALATLAWQPVFLPLALAALLTGLLVPGWRAKLGALVRFALGGIVVTGAMVGYFAAVGAVPELYEGFWAVNSQYTTQRGLFRTLEMKPNVLVNGYGPGWIVAVAGLGLTLLLALVKLPRLDQTSAADCAVVGVGGATVAAVGWSVNAFQSWPDSFVLLPLACVGVGGLAQLVASRLPRRLVVGVVAVVAAGALATASLSAWTLRSDILVRQRALSERLLDIAGPDATVASIAAPQPLVFGELRNPIRHQMFAAGLSTYLDETYPGGLDAIAAEIEAANPTIITVDSPAGSRWLSPVLEGGYKRVGGSRDSFVWFVTETVSAEQLEEMRKLVVKSQSGKRSRTVQRSVP